MKNKGFTVIELVMVIAIISIILSVAAMNFFNIQNDARGSKIESDLRVLKLAAETFCSSKMKYPDDLLQLENGPVIQTLPKDPYNSDNNYQYFVCRDYFAIWSVGLNGTSGTVIINFGGKVDDTDADDIGTTNGACPNLYWK
ncbi:MAG: type II secretion system protein [Candidatus Saganbacteria bacterium]|nr:type II secretion system protein [Candidatus Saganbacteria bacterium]